jgi:hypothetical protein
MPTDNHVQDAQEPEWVLNRDAVTNDKLYLAEYRFTAI